MDGLNPDQRLSAAGATNAPKPGALPLIDPRNWKEPAPARRWNVQDWVPRGVVTAVYGDGGMGKTLAAQQLLTSTALGADWCGLPATPGRALGIFCEDDENELHRRQEAINRAYGCSMADLADLRMVTRFGGDNAMVRYDAGSGSLTDFHGKVVEACAGWQPDLLVLDTAADLYPDNENDRGKVRWFVQHALGQIARSYNCGVVLLAHPSQSGLQSGTGAGGSTAWNNTVRSRLYLEREGGEMADPNARTLSRKKANYAGPETALRLVWRDGAFLREDAATGSAGIPWATIDAMFTEIDRAWRAGKSWSNAPQTRKDGRYFASWAKTALSVPEKQTTALIGKWIENGFIEIAEADAKLKKNGLRVVRRLAPDEGH